MQHSLTLADAVLQEDYHEVVKAHLVEGPIARLIREEWERKPEAERRRILALNAFSQGGHG